MVKSRARKGANSTSRTAPVEASSKTQVEKCRLAAFQPEFFDDMNYWLSTDAKTAKKIWNLVKEVLKTPFTGTGKPEALKYLSPNTWSRRINEVDRLVYVVFDDKIEFHQAKGHYS